ncbi:MAG: hypothetical protein SP4CHLAM5_01010 [Chlamydiia bacterium]|nr:hypothetical protein [Chlamydiia bacterium]MCH9617977.1 hypothetical protein [Chlamydiia bacterium]MCH9623698.1 hypothetical protein [Chlamydiia bacterium]
MNIAPFTPINSTQRHPILSRSPAFSYLPGYQTITLIAIPILIVIVFCIHKVTSTIEKVTQKEFTLISDSVPGNINKIRHIVKQWQSEAGKRIGKETTNIRLDEALQVMNLIEEMLYKLEKGGHHQLSKPKEYQFIQATYQGNTEAIAIVDKKIKYLAYILTNPKNIPYDFNNSIRNWYANRWNKKRLKGAGSSLMEHFKNMFKGNDLKVSIYLHASKSLKPFYNKHGFFQRTQISQDQYIFAAEIER